MSIGFHPLADLAPESSNGPENIAIVIGLVVIVVAAVAVLTRSARRRNARRGGGSTQSTLAVLPLLGVVLADAAPSGPILIGFLVFVLVLVGIVVAGVVLAIIGIRRRLRRRAAPDES